MQGYTSNPICIMHTLIALVASEDTSVLESGYRAHSDNYIDD